MARDPVTASAEQTLDRFMDDVAATGRHTSYPVVRGDRVVGLLPLSHVLRTPRGEWATRRVEERMLGCDEVPSFHEDDDAFAALTELGEHDLHRALVRDDGRLAGLLSIGDLARALAPGTPRPRKRA